MPRKFKRIRTLLYGDQRFRPTEVELLHTPALQRLYDLHQLGLTDRIYIDASHARLHHVVGVMEQATNLCDALTENLKEGRDLVFRVLGSAGDRTTLRSADLAEFVSKRTPVIRLIGLLHDLTHAPYGHTVEDEIELISSKHDDPARQAEAFYKLLCQFIGWLGRESGRTLPASILEALTHPAKKPIGSPQELATFGAEMLKDAANNKPAGWECTAEDITELLASLYCAMTALLHLELLHAKNFEEKLIPKKEYDFQKVLRTIVDSCAPGLLANYEFVPRRDAFMLDVIGNTVCADLLDYAQRDAGLANLKLGYDAGRIAENFTLVVWDACTYDGDGTTDRRFRAKEDPFSGGCIRTAIALFSRKLRTDVPSELMNLLNVRFYLYERVLYHPTKCAAGAMLGTALQLLGAQADTVGLSTAEALPESMRYLGDSVFLDQVYQAGRLALAAVREASSNAADETLWADKALALLTPKIDCPQFETARTFVSKWRHYTSAQALDHLEAGCDLLCRLTSRRFYKLVFRNLPNAHNKLIKRKSEDLAEHFLNASVRYKVERMIETQANLTRGSVAIHCPRMNTARKIANVLLVLSDVDGEHGEIKKLRHVGELDAAVFGAHQTAIKAVEDMYRSMWRLAVYVAPEYLDRWEEIAETAGKVIFQEFDRDGDHPQAHWENDHHLIRELGRKYGRRELREAEDTRLPEVQRLITSGFVSPESADEEAAKALRRQAVLKVILPAMGKEQLDRREEKLFTEFLNVDVLPMTGHDFVSWLRDTNTTFSPPQTELPLEGARHFKTAEMTSVLEKLRATLASFKNKA